jgi:predicted Zn-dependent protease
MTTPATEYAIYLSAVQQLAQAGRLAEAVSHLEDYAAAHPAHAEAWNDVGALHHALHQLGPALAAARCAVELDGANPLFRQTCATILLDAGDPQEAAKILEPALAGDPRSIDGLVLASDIMIALGRPQDARWFLARALEVDPTSVLAAEKMVRAGAPAGP